MYGELHFRVGNINIKYIENFLEVKVLFQSFITFVKKFFICKVV